MENILTETTRMAAKAIRTTTVLLIEDRTEDAELTLAAFREMEPHWDFHIARDGVQATQFIQDAAKLKSPVPDLILLDLNLPKKDGRQLLAEFRNDPLLRRTPIVVITGSRSEEDIETCHRSNAASFVFKPANWDQYRAMASFIGEFWRSHAMIPPVWVNSLGTRPRGIKEQTPLMAALHHLMRAQAAATNAGKNISWYEVVVVALNLKYAWEAITSFGDDEIRAETGLHREVEKEAPWIGSRLATLEQQLLLLEGKVADLAYEMESFSHADKAKKTSWLENQLKEMVSSLKSVISQENQIIVDQFTDIGQPG